jgi:hypothetical protein
MKKILLTSVVLLMALVGGAGMARADSYSSSGSCSGTLQSWGDFYAYTYQYVYISNNTFESEDHSLSFSGFLAGAENAQWVSGKDDKWVLYRAGDFDIAVPYITGAGLFVYDNRYSSSEWIKLCSY